MVVSPARTDRVSPSRIAVSTASTDRVKMARMDAPVVFQLLKWWFLLLVLTVRHLLDLTVSIRVYLTSFYCVNLPLY